MKELAPPLNRLIFNVEPLRLQMGELDDYIIFHLDMLAFGRQAALAVRANI